MDETKHIQTDKEASTAHRSLKKSLALATVAASLGMALGVNVADVLAAEKQLSSPPNALSRQDKDIVVKQHKDTTQIQQSTQQKLNQSKQMKLDTQTPQNLYGK